MHRFRVSCVVLLAPISLVFSIAAQAASGPPTRAEAGPADHFDVSPPLWLMRPAEHYPRPDHEPGRLPRPANTGAPDPVIQSWHGPVQMPAASTVFEGVGNGFSGPAGLFSVNVAPPDTNGAIGPAHYVQLVNADFAVFNRNGSVAYGPVATNSVWSGFGGLCESDNDGDGVVLYDRAADRWVLTQFAVHGADGTTTSFLECVAVSTTGDPTGSWARYAFPYADFPDYPKVGVWPDAYYVSFNMFSAALSSFLGGKVCAYDRTRMLAGLSATQQCFDLGTNFGGVLPSDLDGAQAPPAGSPNYIVGMGEFANQLALWKFHVDWGTPANSTLSAANPISVAAFSDACGGGTCIPQIGTTNQLDSLADRLMFRLSYRRFSDHESLVVNHSVTANTSTGIRWYEIRDPNGAMTINQQGTYAPDGSFRWMGSVAMDQAGNMAMGFSVSDGNSHPGIRFTGRLATDPLNQMDQGESTLKTGAGSESTGLSRWGDYSSINIDPLDDCTFWYTTEDIPADGTFNWQTWIGSFKFDDCPANDFALTITPSSQTIPQLGSATYSVQGTVTRGSPGLVTLSLLGLPTGVTGSFSSPSFTPAGGSVLTLSASASAPAVNASSFSVRGTSPFTSRVATGAVSVPPNDFGLSAPNVVVLDGMSVGMPVSTTVVSGRPEPITFSVTGLPTGVSGVFTPGAADAGNAVSLALSAAEDAPAVAGAVIVIHGITPSTSHVTSAQVTVPVNDFALTLSPASTGVPTGGSNTVSVQTTVSSGVSRPLALSLSGLPTGVTGTFNPTSVDAGTPSTLTLSAMAGLPLADAGVTITGTSPAASHSVLMPLLVLTAPTVQMTAPTADSKLSASVTLAATATVSVGTSLAKIEFYVDGSKIDPPATTSPGTVTWNTTSVPNGAHVLTAKVYDAANDTATSSPVTVTVSNKVSGCSCNTEPGLTPLLGALGLLGWVSTRRRSRRPPPLCV